MIDECETEISDLRALLGKTGGMNITTLEKEKRQLEAELSEARQQRDKLSSEIGNSTL